MELVHHDHPIRVIGRYALYGKLASGGMATVHFGRLLGPAGFSRTVAIKRLHPQFAKDPEFVAMFLDEARLAARIQHPNVVATVDVVALQEELFLVMDYIRGESFSRLMRASRKRDIDVPLGVISSIIVGMLHGLHAAHEARDERGQPLSVVHRDVSPQNVLVGVDGVARVLDFGVAKAAARIQITRDGQMKGKLSYMSPEQLQGKVVDRRTDIFAAGIVLWEALTGRRLFDAEEASEVLRMIVNEEIPPPSAVVPSIARGVDDIVMRALSRDLGTRYETARQFAIALEEAAPLASPREVGEWVELVAGDTLLHRELAVAEIEAVSSVSEVSLGAKSLPPLPGRISGTPPPRTIPDLTKPWDDDDDPTRISSSTSGLTTKRDGPPRLHSPQVPRPRSSRPPPLLGPEHIGFGALLDEEPRTNVIESPADAADEAPTSLFAPGASPAFGFRVPDAEVSVPASRAIVVRERVSMPPTIIVQSSLDPSLFRNPSAFSVAVGWLWDNPRQRTWRVAAAAGTVALLLGFGVAAGRGARPKSGARREPVSSAVPVVLAIASAIPEPRGVDPTTLPEAEGEALPAASTALEKKAREPAPHAAERRLVEVPAATIAPAPAASTAQVTDPGESDLLESESPYSGKSPAQASPKPATAAKPASPSKPSAAATVAVPVATGAPPPDAVPPGCRQPYVIDSSGIRRIKPECL
jgi:serine/threonine-protein kinase